MSVRHPIPCGKHVDFSTLRAELSDLLGFRVDIVGQQATDDDAGEVICEHPESGEWLDVDDAGVAAVVAAHVPPPRPPTREEQALAAFDAAPSVTEKLDAFREYLVGQVRSQAARREFISRRQDGEQHVAR